MPARLTHVTPDLNLLYAGPIDTSTHALDGVTLRLHQTWITLADAQAALGAGLIQAYANLDANDTFTDEAPLSLPAPPWSTSTHLRLTGTQPLTRPRVTLPHASRSRRGELTTTLGPLRITVVDAYANNSLTTALAETYRLARGTWPQLPALDHIQRRIQNQRDRRRAG